MSIDKKYPILGHAVREFLIKNNVESPITDFVNIESHVKIEKLTDLFSEVWKIIGLDLTDDSIRETPKRMAKMYVNEIYYGLKPENFPKCTTVENKMGYDAVVVERNINVQSNCEHHGVVIDGLATVAYIPNQKVLGLSKINRIVEYFAKRPQIQERLTEQVYHALRYILETDNIAIVIDAQHFCVKSRGVQDTNSRTVTSKLGGQFKTDPMCRNEFMSIFNKQ